MTRRSCYTSYISPLQAFLLHPSAPACRFWEPSPASFTLTLPPYYFDQWSSRTARTLASRIPLEQWCVQGSSTRLTNLILRAPPRRSLFRCDLNHTNPFLSTWCQTCCWNLHPGSLKVLEADQMVKAREFVRQAKSSFVYGEVGGFLLPSWI